MYQRALAGKERALGPDHTSTLTTVNNLGLLYSDQGRLNEAKEMYQRALTGYEKALGPDHRKTMQVMECLKGVVYCSCLIRHVASCDIYTDVTGPLPPITALEESIACLCRYRVSRNRLGQYSLTLSLLGPPPRP
jgi:tetratricopeptide (TPR) repeat protein